MLVSCLIPDGCWCIKIFPSGAEQAFKQPAFEKARFCLIQLFSPKIHLAGLQRRIAVVGLTGNKILIDSFAYLTA